MTGYDDVRHVALARIIVHNVPSIQVDWSRYGPKLAQVALTVGADDVDAVSAQGETTEGRRRAPLEEIRRNIRAAGQEPVERNGRFDVHDWMTSVRLGAVGYLNARPLVFGLDRSPRFDLRFDVPSRCAALLHEEAIDVGLIPSIEYLTCRQVPGRAGSRDRLSRAGGVGGALHDEADARTCGRLRWTRVRARRWRWCACCARGCTRSSPAMEALDADLSSMLKRCDAALIIGDNALFLNPDDP